MIIEWSRQSAEDIRSLYRFLYARSPKAAARISRAIVIAVERSLSKNPALGHAGRVPDTRELVIPKTPYIAPYRVRRDRIIVLRVYHHSERWPDQL
jgi:addiction module RelE/StbE family toxin